MKNLLNYFYHIYPDKIFKKEKMFYFYIEENKFYFIEFNRNIEELVTLVELTNMLFERKIKVQTFIKNVNDSFFVNYMGNNYVLLRVNINDIDQLDYKDIIIFNNYVKIEKSILHIDDWETRWVRQVDIFEQQVLEYNKEFPTMINTFDYYIGLAENAISYLKTMNKEEIESISLFLSHKRIQIPITYETFYNPLTFMFDYRTRDISEYIKCKFFNDNFNFKELEEYIKNNKNILSLGEVKLLYARLIFPTYYFDYFNNVINGKKEDKTFEHYIKKVKEYEEFLTDAYNYIKLHYNIEPIDWIVNNK